MKFCLSGLTLAISTGSFDSQSKALEQLALIKLNSGDFSGAKEDASAAQKAAKLAGNLYLEACALRTEAIALLNLARYSPCVSLLGRATYLLNMCGMSGGELHITIMNAQAEVHRCKSEYAEARNIHIDILHKSTEDQTPHDRGFALLSIAQIDVEIGASQHDVQQTLVIADLLFQKIKYSTGLQYCDMFRAALDVQQCNFSAARRVFQKCLRSAWGEDAEAVAYCLGKLGSVKQWSQAGNGSFSWTVSFLAHSFQCKQRLELHLALQFLGDAFHIQGDRETAISLFRVALDGFSQMDVHRSRAECMVQLGDILKLNGNELKAAELWETARPLFGRSSQGKQLADLDSKLAALGRNQSQEAKQENPAHLSHIQVPPAHFESSPDSEEIQWGLKR
jgi:tetratricopeptide (TPR) repeat protein